MKLALIAAGLVVLIAGLLWTGSAGPDCPKAKVQKQSPLVCGNIYTGMHYTADYAIEDGFIIDLVHGGIWPEQECTERAK